MTGSIEKKDIGELTGIQYECECGMVHKVLTKKIVVEEGALKKTFDIISELGFGSRVLIVADTNTYNAAGEMLKEVLNGNGIVADKFIFNCGELHADEKALGSALVHIKEGTDLLIAVGSGTINDIVRFISFKLGIPYMIAATAPSMDGYASTVSPLMVNAFKMTYNAVHPIAIIGDIDILKNAPMPMISAGFGDMAGKITAIADWMLAREFQGEHFCPSIAGLTVKALKKCVESAEGLKERNDESIRKLTEGLILSGIAMQMMGNSRPASGAEHHIAHYWEIQDFMKGKRTPLHGIKVGAAVLLILSMYEKVIDTDIRYIKAHVKNADEVFAWENEIKRCYGPLSGEIIKAGMEQPKDTEELNTETKRIISRWDAAMAAIKPVINTYMDIKDLIRKTGGAISPLELDIPKSDVYDALRYAKEIRNRYTILRLADRLGLLDEYARQIADSL